MVPLKDKIGETYTPFIDADWDRVLEVSLTGSTNLREDISTVIKQRWVRIDAARI